MDITDPSTFVLSPNDQYREDPVAWQAAARVWVERGKAMQENSRQGTCAISNQKEE